MSKELNEVFTVTIDNLTGESQIDVQGSDGQSCLTTTKALETALTGGNQNLIKRVLKSEALNRVTTKAKNFLKAK